MPDVYDVIRAGARGVMLVESHIWSANDALAIFCWVKQNVDGLELKGEP